jgi:hypothetical protein
MISTLLNACAAGSRVKVARVDGPLLMVEAIETDA